MRAWLLLLLFSVLLPASASAGLLTRLHDRQDDAYCQSLGAKPGTDAYIHCRLVRAQMRQQRSQSLDCFAVGNQMHCY